MNLKVNLGEDYNLYNYTYSNTNKRYKYPYTCMITI